MRGNPWILTHLPMLLRSIPAHAGEPLGHSSPVPSHRVYPRACGGTPGWVVCAASVMGLSPRMRGNLKEVLRDLARIRSIPAHAGEPSRTRRSVDRSRVYPRACGGTPASRAACATSKGLSPRMRGNPCRDTRPGRRRGSIPAHAGEPSAQSSTSGPPGVYPRACGGTLDGAP